MFPGINGFSIYNIATQQLKTEIYFNRAIKQLFTKMYFATATEQSYVPSDIFRYSYKTCSYISTNHCTPRHILM